MTFSDLTNNALFQEIQQLRAIIATMDEVNACNERLLQVQYKIEADLRAIVKAQDEIIAIHKAAALKSQSDAYSLWLTAASCRR